MISQEQAISPETTAVETSVAQPVVESAPVVAQDVAQPTGLLNMLSEDLRQVKSLSNFSDVNELAKSFINAQQLIGKRMQDLSPEDLKIVDSLRGVPSSPIDYKLPEELPAEITDAYKNIATQAKLTQEQAKVVLDSYIMLERDAVAKREEYMQQQYQQSVETLKKDFGPAFDKQLTIAKRAVESFGGEELKAVLNETGLGNNPAVVKAFASIGQKMLEDTVVAADHDATFGITPETAKNKISLKMQDPQFRAAYLNALHPNHKEAISEMEKLWTIVGPSNR